jgi:hypothetical protein
MDLPELLRQSRTSAIADALHGLSRAALPHYTASGAAENRERLTELYDLTVRCVRERNLALISEYARAVAAERHRDGFGLAEVHTAFNVLEEVIWHRITTELEPRQYAEALGLVSTVLGAGKHALALEYVSLVGHDRQFHSLDLSALFKGTA